MDTRKPELTQWELVAPGLWRTRVISGWVYKAIEQHGGGHTVSICFAPDERRP